MKRLRLVKKLKWNGDVLYDTNTGSRLARIVGSDRGWKVEYWKGYWDDSDVETCFEPEVAMKMAEEKFRLRSQAEITTTTPRRRS